MPILPFAALPDGARLWAFATDRPLNQAARDTLLQTVDAFLEGWKAHGQPLSAGRELRYDRFLFVAVDEAGAGASGCSIDALVHQMRDLERGLGVTLTDNSPVYYRAGDAVYCSSRAEFRKLAAEGDVDLNTIVFDNTIQTVGALNSGKWEVPARTAWHGGAFFKATPRA